MYDWPETRAATDAEWTRFCAFFQRAGIDAPKTIVRRNADMPAVPGGIRDARGQGDRTGSGDACRRTNSISRRLWRHPDLLLAQTCWGPMELGLAEHVQVVGQPSYNGFEGGQGQLYSSAILDAGGARRHVAPLPTARRSSRSTCIRGKRFAYNSLDSMSGIMAPSRDLEAMGESLDIFSERIETGAHRASIVAVAEGRADVCAIDCRSWHMAKRHEPKAGRGRGGRLDRIAQGACR